MKKIYFLFVFLLFVLTLTACGGTKVTFDIGDATLISGETVQTYKKDSPISPPLLEKEGYVFAGWDKDFSAPTEAITVKPCWKKLHTVQFDLNGGTVDNENLLTQKIIDGSAPTPPIPTKDKYTFIGWDQDTSTVTGDMIVKAVWERKTFTSTEIFNLVNPATVEIKTYRLNRVYFGTGSGFFINSDGLLLTNYHVIEDAREIVAITYDGMQHQVTRVVAYDIEKDIALLQVQVSDTPFAYLDIATELPKSGEQVWALGSSLGLTGTFSDGIVSYVNREINGVKFIQTSTPISEGNSGGPLVNAKGYVIGINSASYTEGQNLNLAVEISQYKTLSEVNLSVEALFQKEGTLKYYIGERNIVETSKSQTSGQIVTNGTTVQGYHDGGNNYDFYMMKCPQELSIMLVMIKADSEDALFEIDSYMDCFLAQQDIRTEIIWLPYDLEELSGIIDDGNGTLYYMALIPASEEFYSIAPYLGVAIAADAPTDYQIFLYYITEDMIEGVS